MRVGIHPDIRRRWFGTITTCLLVAAWLYGNIPSLEWLFRSISYASRLNLILVGAIAILLLQVVRKKSRGTSPPTPLRITERGGKQESGGEDIENFHLQLQIMPLVLMVASTIGAIALRWIINIPEFSVLLFLLGTYGLGGLFLAPEFWRKNLPTAAFVACIIPFNTQLGSGLGLPARILTAHGVEQFLSAWHIAAISSNDIIVLENGIAHVDLPCSGLKSLWTGTLFLLAATWLERRQLGVRWLLVCIANVFFLVSANTVRVLLLVLITYVLKLPQIAEILHIPLGILGFIFASGLTWILLQKVPKQEQGSRVAQALWGWRPRLLWEQRSRGETDRNATKKTLLLVVVIALALISRLYQPQDQQPTIAVINWPQQMQSEPVSLTAAEQRFFSTYSSTTIPEKRRFVFGDISGSMLVVASTSWGSFHAPELCFVGSGFKVDRVEKKRLTPSVVARWLSLQDGKLSATYWLQSPKQTTDDFLSRIWSDVTKRTKTWVMISVLFDSSLSPDHPKIREFSTTVHDAIADSFQIAGEQEKAESKSFHTTNSSY